MKITEEKARKEFRERTDEIVKRTGMPMMEDDFIKMLRDNDLAMTDLDEIERCYNLILNDRGMGGKELEALDVIKSIALRLIKEKESKINT